MDMRAAQWWPAQWWPPQWWPAGRAWLATIGLGLGCALSACATGTGTGAGTGAGAGAGAGATAATTGPAAAQGASPAPIAAAAGRPAAALRFCPKQPAAALRADLSHAVPRSLQEELVPLGVSGDGQIAYVSAWTPGFAGVAELDIATGKLREIQRFADPVTDQADGTSGGQWLVWEETYSLQTLDDFTVYSFDAAAGRLRALGHSLAGPGAVAWPSPWHGPAVSGRYAAWAQGYGPGGLVEIRLANLATGQVRVIRQGHVQPPFFDGSLVVWPESDSPGSQTALHAYSLVTGRAAALPPVLRAVHGTEFVATDGTRTAYFSADLTELYYSPLQQQRASMVLRLPPGVDFADLSIGRGALAWTTSRATYLASTQTGAYSQVTPDYGYATGSGQVMLVSDAPSRKAAHPVLALHVVSAAALAGPGCGG